MSLKQNDEFNEAKKEAEEEMCERCGEKPATTCIGYALGKEYVCQDCFEGEMEEREHDEPDWIMSHF